MNKRIDCTTGNLLLGLAFVFLFLTESEIPVLKYSDEIVELISFFYLILHCKSRYLIDKRKYICIFVAFLTVGLMGSLLWRKQTVRAIIEDSFFSCGKFMIAYLSGYVFFSRRNRKIDWVVFLSKIMVIFMSVVSIHDLFFAPWFSRSEYRLFFFSQRGFFAHPTFLTHAAVTLLCLFSYVHLNKRKKMTLYLILASWNIVIAGRSKGVAFLLAFWIMYLYFFVLRKKKKTLVYCGAGVAAVAIGLDSFKAYYSSTAGFSPRRVLLFDSIKIMLSRFPFGLGYASFGSPVAARYYSKQYTLLGYQELRGMNPTDKSFLSDSFWPIIIGQFGVMGMLMFLRTIYLFIHDSLKIWKINKSSGFIMMAILVYIIICSLAETSFFNPTSMLLFFLLSYIEAKEKNTFRVL